MLGQLVSYELEGICEETVVIQLTYCPNICERYWGKPPKYLVMMAGLLAEDSQRVPPFLIQI
jgi:hypothetical protein